MVRKERETTQDWQERIEALLRRGEIDAAIVELQTQLETSPEDWSAMLALGDLLVRQGRDDEALERFRVVAEHYYTEGFLSRAAAVYKRILRVREDDHALLSLTDIAAREGQLAEAKRYLLELQQQRRARGDIAGAEECVRVLEAMIDVRDAPEPPAVPEPAYPWTVTTPPGETGAAAEDPASADEPESAEPDLPPPIAAEEPAVSAAPDPEAPPPTAAPLAPAAETAPDVRHDSIPSRPTLSVRRGKGLRRHPGRTKARSSAPGKPKPLQSVFDELRTREQDDGAARAQKRFDEAQYYLRDGDEAAAIAALEEAAELPALRFTAAAQLGRLHIARGDVAAGITWLERASLVPPVTPDEGLAVMYELADALEQVGQEARALAVFLDLQSQRRLFRDLAARIERLSRAMDGDQ